MGLLGIIVTVAVMVFGAGYLLSGSMRSSETFESSPAVAPVTEQIAQGMEAIDMAKDASRQGIEISQQSADAIRQEAVSDQETMEDGKQSAAESSQPARVSIPPKSASGGQSTTKDPIASGTDVAIVNRLVSFGFAKHSDRSIDTIVLHSSYNSTGGDVYSVDKVIAIWKSYGVAPHYMIDRKGNIYRLVEDTNIAYHAGVSEVPDGRENVNDFSIGIEILNTLDDNYTDAQYAAVKRLVASLKEQYKIKYVLGHDDIAPGRKTDPWNFDWKRLK